MRITLRLYGNLRRYNEGRRETLELSIAEGTTIEGLFQHLEVPENSWWMTAVNDRVVAVDTVLHEDDLIEVFDPVGGGSVLVD